MTLFTDKTSSSILGDCVEVMKDFKDNQFDLLIADPPYFSGPEKLGYYGRSRSSIGVDGGDYKGLGCWDVPTAEYFEQAYRVSKHQIIWGCNYYAQHIVDVGRIVWDKVNIESSFSDVEIASCSLHYSARLFTYMWNGMMQGESISNGRKMQGNKKLNEKRIHPTQKPILLYGWLLQKYAKEGWSILDTHLGSGSSRIAAHRLGFDFVGIEKDILVYQDQEKRWIEETKINLFTN
jgi:site-specific DNA-methyltransferase (adenine-specific)